MLAIAALTGFALVLARALGAPPGAWRLIAAAGAGLLLAASLLPPGNPYHVDLPGLARAAFWIALALIPVAAYALWLRGLRRRAAGPAPAAAGPRPRGLVQFAEDEALAAETAAALAEETEAALPPGGRLSLGWRGADGGLEGHLRLRLRGDLAEVELLRVAPAARRRGVGAALVAAAEAEAAGRGARRIGALVGDWQAPGFFARAGFAAGEAHGPGDGARRRWMEKPL